MSEILSQDEVNALLKGVSEGVTPPEGGAQNTPGVQACDLTNHEQALSGRLPGLDRVFDAFVRALRTSMEALIGEVGGLMLTGVELLRYGNWARRLSTPVSMHLFRLSPLRGHGLVVLSPALAAAMLEATFGGKPQRVAPVERREYSSIETRVLQRFAARVLADFQDAWRPIHPLELSILRSEWNPAHAAVATDDAMVLVAELRILLEEQDEMALTICMPQMALDAVRAKLTSELETPCRDTDERWGETLRDRIADVAVGVTAELGCSYLTMRQVLALKPGDVVTLETRQDEAILVCVEHVPQFYGIPGVARDGHAVRIVHRVHEEPAGVKTG